jgi:hypothetical protein
VTCAALRAWGRDSLSRVQAQEDSKGVWKRQFMKTNMYRSEGFQIVHGAIRGFSLFSGDLHESLH